MKILQVTPHPYIKEPKGGGVFQYVRNISERLVRDHDVTVFSAGRGSLPRHENIRGVEVERFKSLSPGNAYFFSLEMLLRLRKANFDIVHGHCYQAFPLHFSVLAKRRRFVVSTHFHGVGHSVFRNSLLLSLRPFGRRTLKLADKIVAVSDYEKSLLLKQFSLDPSKIAVIPAGVNLSEFKDLKKQKRDFKTMLYVGRLESYKGPQYLIEILPKLDDNVVLDIVGKGFLRPVMERRARELNVTDRVKFFENLPRRELVQKFIDADVFVLLSSYEAYSMVVAEALAAGTPCVVANTSALKEWIDNETCFGVDFPTSTSELTKLVDHVLKERINKETYSAKLIGGKIADWSDVVRQLEAIYYQRTDQLQ